MLDQLFILHRNILDITDRPFHRYFIKKYGLENRFSIITGQRGVGKTTTIIQYILEFTHKDILSKKALYVPVDHFKVAGHAIYDIAEAFVNHGGKLLCLDEIHKYPGWSAELKSIYDSFPDLKLIVSGSSALEIHKGSHDLSRRAIIHKMTGLSFREFLEMKHGIKLPVYDLESLLSDHEAYSRDITREFEKKDMKVLPLFNTYLRHGYFPYFMEFTDERAYFTILEQGLHTTIESDLLSIYPRLSGVSVKKIKLLLSAIASSAPFTPDMKRLKNIVEIGDERTLKTYLKYLEDAGVITCLPKSGRSIRKLEKPEKVYLNNTNQAFAISNRTEIGTIRELFFARMLMESNTVEIPPKGDFQVNGRDIFEIGGKGKTFRQIKDQPHSYLALDNIEQGMNAKIPLWLFGFLY